MISVADAVVPFLCAGVGAYLGSYLKKKGENLATREDFNILLQQLRETTSATKAIESRFTNELWDRQKQWEMKRDAIFAVLLSLRKAHEALMALSVAYQQEQTATNPEHWLPAKKHAVVVWEDRIFDYDNAHTIAMLVCSDETITALRQARDETRRSASKIFKKQITSYDDIGELVRDAFLDVMKCARRELGLDQVTPLS